MLTIGSHPTMTTAIKEGDSTEEVEAEASETTPHLVSDRITIPPLVLAVAATNNKPRARVGAGSGLGWRRALSAAICSVETTLTTPMDTARTKITCETEASRLDFRPASQGTRRVHQLREHRDQHRPSPLPLGDDFPLSCLANYLRKKQDRCFIETSDVDCCE